VVESFKGKVSCGDLVFFECDGVVFPINGGVFSLKPRQTKNNVLSSKGGDKKGCRHGSSSGREIKIAGFGDSSGLVWGSINISDNDGGGNGSGGDDLFSYESPIDEFSGGSGVNECCCFDGFIGLAGFDANRNAHRI
jgi:hypothetical protein